MNNSLSESLSFSPLSDLPVLYIPTKTLSNTAKQYHVIVLVYMSFENYI